MSDLALVTGAGSGIGRCIAVTLAARGVAVIVLDNSLDKCHTVAEEIRNHGGVAYEAVADVRMDKEIREVKECLATVVQELNILVNCAGISRNTPFLDITTEEWRLMLDIHLKGTYLICKNFVPFMLKNHSGIIINMSSDFAINGFIGRAHYCAAKRGIHALTKSLALELAPSGIRVNSLGPGPIDTPLLKGKLSEEDYAQKLANWQHKIPLGRTGKPEDVAGLAAWLALGGGKYINGQLLHVNGGMVMY